MTLCSLTPLYSLIIPLLKSDSKGQTEVKSSVDHPPQSTKPIQGKTHTFDRRPQQPYVINDHKRVIKLFQTKQLFTFQIKDSSEALRIEIRVNECGIKDDFQLAFQDTHMCGTGHDKADT